MKHLLTATVTLLVMLGFSPGKAYAAVLMTMNQVGSDVSMTGSGSINLSGLSFLTEFTSPGAGLEAGRFVMVGNTALSTAYQVSMTGPSNIGPGNGMVSGSGTGDLFGIQYSTITLAILVPSGYVSNSPLSGTGLLPNATLASLGVTPGVYNWTVSNGETVQLTVGSDIPEPGTVGLLGIGLAFVAVIRRPRRT